MKTWTILLLTFLSVTVNKCDSDKDLKENLAIEYEARSRALQSKVIIKNDSIVVMDQGTKEGVWYYPLSKSDWNNLVKKVKQIDRTKINQYHAPSDKRAVDLARTAQIKVIYKGEVYQSHLFDEGNPPKEIKDFTDKVASFYKPKHK